MYFSNTVHFESFILAFESTLIVYITALHHLQLYTTTVKAAVSGAG